MRYEIRFTTAALDDLAGIYDHAAERSGPLTAFNYVERIRGHCRGFADFPARGTYRDDIVPGLRIVGFERRVTIAFHIEPERVVFDRILYGGRSLEKLGDDD